MFRIRQSLAALVGLFALAAAPAFAARNRVEDIDVEKRADGRIDVRIETTAPPTFQSFSRRAPALVILDLVDTGAVERTLASPGAPIEEIRLTEKRGKRSSTARLTLRFSEPVEYDVTADGRSITLSLFPSGAARDLSDEEAIPVASVSSGKQAPLRIAAQTPADTPVRHESVSPRLAQKDEDEAAGMATAEGDAAGLAMTYIGFKNREKESELYARMNGRATFEIKREGDNLLVLEISDADIPLRNNRNHLDTTFFDSPVKMITPTVVDGSPTAIRIIIEMKENVPYRTTTRGNDVVVLFQK